MRRRGDWAAARKALTEVLAIRQRQPDRRDWRIADAKRGLADIDRRAALNPTQRQRLQEAGRLTQRVMAHTVRESMPRESTHAEGLWRYEAS